VQPNQSIELQIKFKGSIPEIDPDETGPGDARAATGQRGDPRHSRDAARAGYELCLSRRDDVGDLVSDSRGAQR